jgi:uncharacterized phiE125 gp8 family phage protein
MPGLTLVTAASTYPVELADVKTGLGIDTSDWDDRIEQLIPPCTREIERYTDRGFITQTWRLTIDEFEDEIELPHGPVTAVTAFSYLDADGDTQTVSADLYTTDLVSSPQRIVLNPGESWPTVLERINTVTIQFTVGYTPAELLLDIESALIGLINARRLDPAAMMPAGVKEILDRHRRIMI